MKGFLSFLLLLFMVQSYTKVSAQGSKDYTMVYLMSKGVTSDVYLNDRHITLLAKDEVLEYKLTSKDRISLSVTVGAGKVQSVVDGSNGVDYHFIVYAAFGVYLGIKNADDATWKKEQKNIINTVKIEEDPKSPVTKPSTKKSEGGQGTCFLVSPGYFITNNHCVENATEVTISGIDGDFVTKYGATVVATDPSNDLALVKIGNKNVQFSMPPYAIRSSGVAQAERVYALGYPSASAMGQEVKITEGIISSKSGVGNDISKFQISAAVNPGNSGGPLIDEQGNLIGVIFAKSTLAEGAGYAIKASYLETFLKNVEGFEFPVYTNTIQDKSLPDKVTTLKNYIFIVESK